MRRGFNRFCGLQDIVSTANDQVDNEVHPRALIVVRNQTGLFTTNRLMTRGILSLLIGQICEQASND